jgi:hypothetical protein
MTSHYPVTGVQLLASKVAAVFNETQWITTEHKILFCILFMKKVLGCPIPQSFSESLIRRIMKKSLRFSIRLLKRYPSDGILMLVVLIMAELHDNQKYSVEQLTDFHTTLMGAFFP